MYNEYNVYIIKFETLHTDADADADGDDDDDDDFYIVYYTTKNVWKVKVVTC